MAIPDAEFSAVRFCSYHVTTKIMAIPDTEISAVQFFAVCCGRTIHHTAKVSKEVNRQCPPVNATVRVQFLTPYTDPERHKHRVTDRQTNRQTTVSFQELADHTACSSTIY